MSAYDPDRISDDDVRRLLDALAEAMKSQENRTGPLNIMLVGQPGIGKSTVVNTIFGEELAPTGIGAPVTQVPKRYHKDGSPISVYDTPGIEEGNASHVLQDLLAIIDKHVADEEQRIHFVMYGVGAGNVRLLPYEETVIRGLAAKLPVILVVTKCLSPTDASMLAFGSYIRERHLPIVAGQAFFTLAQPDIVGGHNFPSHGLEAVIKALYANLEKADEMAAARTLMARQKVSLQLKIEAAEQVISQHVKMATAAGASPVPVVDTIAVTALQISMMGRITNIMGVTDNPEALSKALMKMMMATSVVRGTIAGAARGFFKVIFPPAGWAIGAATGGYSTQTLGNRYLQACVSVIERQDAGETFTDDELAKAITGKFFSLM